MTPATGAARPATREAMASALAACARPSEPSAMSQVEVEREVERAEDQPGDAVGARPRASAVRDAARAFDQRQHRACPGTAARTAGHLRRPTRPSAASRVASPASREQRAGRRRTRRRLGVVDAHHDARAVGFGGRAATSARSRRARRPWPSGATASSRSSTTASAPLASALSKRSGRLPGTNR